MANLATILPVGMDRLGHSLLYEGPRVNHVAELLWWCLDDGGEALVLITLSHELLHCGPEISLAQDFVGQRLSTRVVSVHTFVHFL